MSYRAAQNSLTPMGGFAARNGSCQWGPLILAVHTLCAPKRETLAHDGHTQRLNRASLEA